MTSSDDSSSDFLDLPPELLERERMLREKNAELENRMKNLLKSSDSILDEPEKPLPKIKIPEFHDVEEPSRNPVKKKSEYSQSRNKNILEQAQQTVLKAKRPQKILPQKELLPVARVAEDNKNLIEIDIPQNVEPIQEVRVDPIPELREALHKIANEINVVSRQISEIKKLKTNHEIQISKLQAELKRTQAENERVQIDTQDMQNQLSEVKERNTRLKSDIKTARLQKIDKFQQQNSAIQKKKQFETKIKKQEARAAQLKAELDEMPKEAQRKQKMDLSKKTLKETLAKEKQSVHHLKLLLAEVARACEQEQKLYEHLQSSKNLPLTPDAIQLAINKIFD